MALSLDEELKRLEVLRNAMRWSDAEYERRQMLVKQKYERPPASPADDRPRPPRGRADWPSNTGTRVAPDQELLISPYRFIELVDAVALPPESVREALQRANLLSQPLADGFCGEVEVTFAAETPLLIGVEDEIDRKGRALPCVVPLSKGSGPDWWVPGASIRGMMRAATEIVGYGRLEQANRHHVYGLRDFEHPYYNDPDGRYGGMPVARASAVKGGWLHYGKRHDGTEGFSIEPSELAYVAIKDLIDAGCLGTPKPSADVWIELPLVQKYERAKMTAAGRIVFRSKTVSFRDEGTDNQGRRRVQPQMGGLLSGTLVFSNQVPRGQRDPKRAKKMEYVLLTPPGTHELVPVPSDPGGAWDRFELVHTKPGRKAREPDGSWKILEPVVKSGQPIPVFYVGDPKKPDETFAFGLTRLFKIPHRQTLGAMIERLAAHKLVKHRYAEYVADLVGALFGILHEAVDLGRDAKEKSDDAVLKGRIAFSGATIDRNSARRGDIAETVMSAPRASFAPYYLSGPIKDWSSDDAKTQIAGRKRYLPRFPTRDLSKAEGAIEARLKRQREALTEGARANEKTMTRLRFLVPSGGTEIRFTSRIRLHNVTAEEIGLVLATLTHFGDEEKRYRHLLGRAKPFGAGQLRVVEARLAVEANVTDPKRLIRDPNEDELPGHEREGLCPAPTKEKKSLSHAPFIDAFVSYMRAQENYDGAVRAAVSRAFPDTPAVRGFLGTSSPDAGAEQLPAEKDTYLRLRMQHPKTGRPINPYNELRKATKKPRPGDPYPAPGHDRLLAAPERPVPPRRRG